MLTRDIHLMSFYICRSKAKIAYFRYLRKQTEAVKEKDYYPSLVLTTPFGMLIPFTFFVQFRTVH